MTKLGEHPTDDLAWWFGRAQMSNDYSHIIPKEIRRQIELQAVRAFVERVEAKLNDLDYVETSVEVAILAMRVVVAEMESNEAGRE
jgi:hypothetical protein